jgi:uncharacterized protein YjbI with pentapeptide repeats
MRFGNSCNFSTSLQLNAAVESDAANEMVDLIRADLLGADFSSLAEDPSGISLVGSEEFS